MTKRAAVYCRLSQDRTGAGVVVERQERECRELATSLGWDVVKVYVDTT
jgi:DNA invertase Pin-like site-specific DNA recombinase